MSRYFINKYSSKIIAINKTSADIINLPAKTEVIYDWIDFKDRDGIVDLNKEYGVDVKKNKVFLFVGGFQKIKGAYEVLSVFTQLSLIENIKLLFISSNSYKYDKKSLKSIMKFVLRKLNRPVLSDKIRDIIKNDKRIVQIPMTKNIKSLYEQVHCLISFPTIPHAILPIAESLWNGNPVIAVDTPEAREYSNGGKSSILVEMNNIKNLENAILDFIKNEEEIKKEIKDSIESIKEKFNEKKNSILLNQLYLKV